MKLKYMAKKLALLFVGILFISSMLNTIPSSAAESTVATTTFVQDNTLVQNPYKGWVIDASNDSILQPHTLVFATFSWRDIESIKGKYDFTKFEKDNNFSYWKSQNTKIILRLYLDYPRSKPHMDIPDWLYTEMKGSGTKYANAYGFGFSPNYNNPTLVAAHKKLVQAISARYDSNPDIAFVQIGSLGHWGEWHTAQNNGVKIPFASQATCDTITIQYVEYFKNKILMMRRPTQNAATYRMGLHNDSFGDIFQTESYFINWITNGYNDTQTGVKNPAMLDFWKYAPSGGEVARYPGEQYFTAANIARTMTQLSVSHTSWLGPSGPYQSTNPEIKKNMNKVLNAMGYKYYISQATVTKAVTTGGVLNATVTMKNVGIAPFYYAWPVMLYIKDTSGNIKLTKKSSVDIRKIMPGSNVNIVYSITLPTSLTGSYNVFVGVVDPSNNQPGIHFANKGNGVVLKIGTIFVGKP